MGDVSVLDEVRPTEVCLCFSPPVLEAKRCIDFLIELATPFGDVGRDRAVGTRESLLTVFFTQPFVDPFRGVALFASALSVFLEPSVDDTLERARTEDRGAPPSGLRFQSSRSMNFFTVFRSTCCSRAIWEMFFPLRR